MSPVDRRRFLVGAGALAVAPPVARRRAAPTQAPTAFAWGVASFDPTPEGVLLWTRAVPSDGGPAALTWVLARDEALDDVVATGRADATPDRDHCVVVPVSDLEPERSWWYAFTAADGARSPVGRTRTMPERTAERLRLGVVSCSRYASAGFAAYRALADRELDLVVHLGDYIYEDGHSGARPHDPPARLRSLADYRARYEQHRTDADLQALHARHPMVAVWDDHEVAGNAWRDGARDHDAAVDGPWIDRLLAAGQAHGEWLPGRTGLGADGRLQAWRTISLGGLAELVVLDTRTWGRDRQPATAAELGGPADGTDRPRTLLGEDQARFVAERLRPEARRPWTVVANQVMLHPLRVPVPSASLVEAIEAAGFLVDDGEAVNPDQWDGYPQARDELLAACGPDGGVVVLTGDVHSSWAWEGPAGLVELVTPSVSSESLATRLPVPAGLVERGLQGVSDDLSHVELSSHGYLVVDLAADRVQAEWWYVDPDRAGSQRFGAARLAPREAPMRLTDVDEPLPDPVPTTSTTTTTTTPSPRAAADPESSDDGVPALAIGTGAAAVTAATAAALALRRRRSR
jgi:alkaline phosphatase D